MYNVRLANSDFTRQFMSYLYGCPFEGYVYPPVDTDIFRPAPANHVEGFAIAIARNTNEPGFRLLERIATKVPLKVVGGATVDGAQNLGVLSDTELASEMGRAAVLVSPSVPEFYGYSVAEALACGTPVVAYDCCGPAEILRKSGVGWLVLTQHDFESRVVQACRSPVEQSVRVAARKLLRQSVVADHR